MNKKNIVFILTDDQGAWAMHCAGNDDIKTPNLDALAKEGVRYDNFFCASPVCSAARASILTGKMPSAHGVHDWLKKGNLTTRDFPELSMNEDVAIEYLEGQKTYVEVLSENGYSCGLSGKWHLGNQAVAKKGFEKWFVVRGGTYYNQPVFEDGKATNMGEHYITDVITERAIDFLDEFNAKERPFYLSVHYTAPHTPWESNQHPNKYIDLYKDCEFASLERHELHINQIDSAPAPVTEEAVRENLRGYFAAITAMDENVGKIIKTLKELGIYEDTVIIFTSDNGMNMGHHGIWGKGNGTFPPNMYDQSVKVPFIVKAPFIKEEGKVIDSLRSHYDLFSTILEIAGIEYCNEDSQPGESFYRELLGEKSEQGGDLFICDEYAIVQMIRNDFKFIKNHLTDEEIFYDLQRDPREDKNEIANPDYQEQISQLREELDTWFAKYRVEKFDGRYLTVTGKGQLGLCYTENAFDTDAKFMSDKHI